MFDRFTDAARSAVIAAQREARELGASELAAQHLVIGLAAVEGDAASILEANGFTLDAARAGAKQGPPTDPSKSMAFSLDLKAALEAALRHAMSTGVNHVGTAELLRACTDPANQPESVAALFSKMGVDGPAVAESAAQALLDASQPSPSAGDAAPAEPALAGGGSDRSRRPGRLNKGAKLLEEHGTDLTAAARAGELDPVVGRDKELERAIQILSRRTKSNPVLVGPPGVGKTAVAEALAQAIAAGSAPETIADSTVYSLNLGSLTAGTRYRGDFEERLRKIIETLTAGDYILFLDEIHTVVGAGSAGGALDASAILKPALARSELKVLGATTDDEYRKYFQADEALSRRFTPVPVDEPSVELCVQILSGLRSRYEDHHNVTFSDEALAAAARLARRHIPDRHLPDSAIDLLDEAGARHHILAYKMAKDADVSEQQDRQATTPADETARPTLDADAVVEVVENWTGVPAAAADGDNAASLLSLEDTLASRVIGQDEAVAQVARAVRRRRSGLGDDRRPAGSFLFLGPTGVGKTELAKALAANLFGSEKSMITIDMSEYMESHSVARLIGAPPGYVGHDEAGQLTEAVRRRPWSVVLLDEIEKAHPDVLNLLLQLLEEGHMTDSHGRKVSFRDTIVIMTSNIGSSDLSKPRPGFTVASEETSFEDVRERVLAAMRKTLRPEIVNRIDDPIVFRPLTPQVIRQVSAKLVAEVADRAAEIGLSLAVTDAALDLFATVGFDPELGARPLRRAIQQMLEDQLANRLLAGEFPHGTTVTVDALEGELVVASAAHHRLEPAPSD